MKIAKVEFFFNCIYSIDLLLLKLLFYYYNKDLALKFVDSWYNQIKFYDFEKPRFNQRARQFSQVVWRSTTRIGCGLSGVCRNGLYYFFGICKYFKIGNIVGEFESNVNLPLDFKF